jgi:hypothetical protein
MADHARTAYINLPDAKAHNVLYEAPPTPQNPIVKGRPLAFLAALYVQARNVQRASS